MTATIKKKIVEKSKSEKIYKLRNALAYAKAIINTIREPLVVLYPKLTISSVNKAFFKTFKTDAKETIGKHLYEIGNMQFDIPLLKELLKEILSKKHAFNSRKVSNFLETIIKVLFTKHSTYLHDPYGFTQYIKKGFKIDKIAGFTRFFLRGLAFLFPEILTSVKAFVGC